MYCLLHGCVHEIRSKCVEEKVILKHWIRKHTGNEFRFPNEMFDVTLQFVSCNPRFAIHKCGFNALFDMNATIVKRQNNNQKMDECVCITSKPLNTLHCYFHNNDNNNNNYKYYNQSPRPIIINGDTIKTTHKYGYKQFMFQILKKSSNVIYDKIGFEIGFTEANPNQIHSNFIKTCRF